MSDLVGVNDTLPVRLGGVSTSSGLPDYYADVLSTGQLKVAISDASGNALNSTSNALNVFLTNTTVSVTQSTSPWITKDQADGPVSPGTVASFSQLAGGQYNSTAPSLSDTQQSALQLDPFGNLRATFPDRSVSGTLGSLGATLTLSGTNGFLSGGLELDGTFSGTVEVQGTIGGTQYSNIGLFNVDAGYNTSLEFTGASTQSIYQLVGVGSYTAIKVTVTAYTSGSFTATLNLSSGIDLLNVVSPYAPNFNVAAVGNVASGTADSGNGIKVSGIYNSSTPTFASGQRADLQTDSSGNLKITGTVVANNPSVSQVNTATPSFATYIGGFASTSPPTWGNGDLAPLSLVNVGGYLRTTDVADGPVTPGTVALNSILIGAQYNSTLPILSTAQQSAIQLDSSGRLLIGSIASALPAGTNSIGTVNQGTANTLANAWSQKITDGTNGPVAVKPASTAALAADPSFVVAFSPNSPLPTGSATIGAVTQASGPWTQNLTQVGGSAIALGQTTMAASLPVAIASNQTALLVSQSGTWTTGRTWTLASGTDSVSVVQTTSPWTVQGDSASGAAKAGNPVQIGGVFNTTQPTVTTGQTVETQSTARGAIIVATGIDNFNINNISGTISLPTGSATSANQATEITSLQLIDKPIGSSTGGTAGSASNLAGGIYNTTLPTLTDGEQVGLQVDSSGRLITSPTTVAQASTTSGQVGNLVMGAVTTTPPTYVTAETDPLSLTIDGDLRVADIVNTSSQYRAQSVTTTAAEALGAATILVNRKLLHITPTNGTIYWGYSSAVTTTTGSPLFPNNTLWLSVGANVHVYLIAAATTDSRVGELS